MSWLAFPGGSAVKESACQCGRYRVGPWVGKSSWSRKWQPIPGFLPGKSRGQRSLALVHRVANSRLWRSDCTCACVSWPPWMKLLQTLRCRHTSELQFCVMSFFTPCPSSADLWELAYQLSLLNTPCQTLCLQRWIPTSSLKGQIIHISDF